MGKYEELKQKTKAELEKTYDNLKDGQWFIETNMKEEQQKATVSDVATVNLITAYPDESLHAVIDRLGDSEVGHIPVIDRRNPQRLVGVLRRHDIVKAYVKSLTRLHRG